MRGALGDGRQEGRSGEGTGGRIRTLVHLLSCRVGPTLARIAAERKRARSSGQEVCQ